MNAQDYVDWCDLSGLYLRNLSHEDRYETYAKQISPAGLTTVVVAEFVHDNPGELNVGDWRTYSVYERSAELQRRIERTAAALDAIGANRIAAAVRTTKSHSPLEAFANLDTSDPEAIMDAIQNFKAPDILNQLRESAARMLPGMAGPTGLPTPQKSPDNQLGEEGYESRSEVEQLLEQFVAEHQEELLEDLKRHGDPRQAPGYTRESRLQELEQERHRMLVHEAQREDIQELKELMTQIRKRVEKEHESKSGKPPSYNSLRRKFLELVKENKRRAADVLLPETTEMLQEAEAFMRLYPAVFQREPIDDPQLKRQLSELGEYDIDMSGGETRLSWEAPAGLTSSWNRFELELVFPQNKPAALRAVLDAVSRLRQRLPRLSNAWREQLIEHFRERQGWMDDWELEDYECDENGEATDESILEHAGTGQIFLLAHDQLGEVLTTETQFPIEWDEEHGLQIPWEDELVEESSDEERPFSLGQIVMVDVGPPLAPGEIERLEERIGAELPADYRQFLRMHNGGRPQPGHLVLRQDGEAIPFDIDCFLSIAGHGTEVSPERSLEEAVELIRAKSLPKSVLPIARLTPVVTNPFSEEYLLLLMLSGKKAGRIIVLDTGTPLTQLPNQQNVSDDWAVSRMVDHMLEYLLTAARSLNDLFQKLKSRPEIAMPPWLSCIRENDIAGFVAWWESGGKLTEQFTSYGEGFPKSVIDYLTKEASPELLRELIERKAVKPGQLRKSWRQFLPFDVDRFRQLMPLLPKDLWPTILSSPQVWDDRERLEELVEAGIDFNAAVDEEGATPIHLAVQLGKKEAVQWLMEHGADPRKPDKYRRDAFIWAENGPGFDCLEILEGRETPTQPTGPSPADPPEFSLLAEAADRLPKGVGLVISIQIKSPPVTRIEKAYYSECHYRLSIDVRGNKVTFQDMTTPRQDYLYADKWPSFLFAPILQWPELTALWETLEVRDLDWQQAIKKRDYDGPLRDDLLPAARVALEQAFQPHEAASRGIRLRKL